MNLAYKIGRERRWALGLLILLVSSVFGLRAVDAGAPLVLENDQVLVEFDPGSGVIMRVRDKGSAMELATDASLRENFRLILPLPDKKTTAILGKDQKLSGYSRNADGLML